MPSPVTTYRCPQCGAIRNVRPKRMPGDPPPTKRVPWHLKVRILDIVHARKSGKTYKQVGAMFGIGPARVGAIMAQWERHESRMRKELTP